jgi:hypothetical protein
MFGEYYSIENVNLNVKNNSIIYMSTSITNLANDVEPLLMKFLLLPLIAPEPKETTRYIIDPDIANIQDLETLDNGFDYKAAKKIFLSENGENEEEELFNENVKQLLKIVMELPEILENTNNAMMCFGGLSIDSNHSSEEIVGGSKNFIVLFLFSILYLLFLMPASAFVINSNVRTGYSSPGNKRNGLTLTAPVIESENTINYNDVVVELRKTQENPRIQEIVKHYKDEQVFENKLKSIESQVDNFLNIDKLGNALVYSEHDIPIITPLKNKLFGNLKKGLTLINVVSKKMSMEDKVQTLISDVLETNRLGVATALAEKLTTIISHLPTPVMTGLAIIKEGNTAFLSPESEVIRIAAKRIFEVMRKDIIKNHGKITTQTVDKYLEKYVLRIGGKRRKRAKKTTKKRNKKGGRGKKSKNYRKK